MTSHRLENFPKLRDVKSEGDIFNMQCPSCKSDNIDLVPLDMSWNTAPHLNSKSKLDKFYKRIPPIWKAIWLVIKYHMGCVCACLDCNKRHIIRDYIDKMKLKKWLHTKYKCKIEDDDV